MSEVFSTHVARGSSYYKMQLLKTQMTPSGRENTFKTKKRKTATKKQTNKQKTSKQISLKRKVTFQIFESIQCYTFINLDIKS